ncbi:PQQ-dependent sugar dehydrogenase [Pseudooceanicola sp.]|uniref:PQQ-dependent sugar dehydrogenase n=1 Tax=Pseudooceanicola sp. TaxID=1914328 RepID=UPI0035C71062
MAFISVRSLVIAAISVPTVGNATTYQPDPAIEAGLVVKLDFVGQYVTPPAQPNIASPVAIGDSLYVVDQAGQQITIQGESGPTTVLSAGDEPAGITPTGKSAFINMAGSEQQVFVGFTSSTLPQGKSAHALPDDPHYHKPSAHYQVIYTYDRESDGTLSNPTFVTAFETAQSITEGPWQGGAHFGEGMLALGNGKLLFSRGDNLNQHYDGSTGPQDPASTVGKLLIIDTDGTVEVAATGIRNVQRMIFTDENQTRIAFTDIGRTVAEEVNVIDTADLLDTTKVENFGWGVDGDRDAREGTFYINSGTYAGVFPGVEPAADGKITIPEAGFITPYAQLGRSNPDGLFAISGPVASDVSFNLIDLLFGDLVKGNLFATMATTDDTLNTVYKVGVSGGASGVTSLQEFLGITRADLRFFNFVDGSAGVLLEQTGNAYRITEVLPAVPLMATGPALLSALGFGLFTGRRRLSKRPD